MAFYLPKKVSFIPYSYFWSRFQANNQGKHKIVHSIVFSALKGRIHSPGPVCVRTRSGRHLPAAPRHAAQAWRTGRQRPGKQNKRILCPEGAPQLQTSAGAFFVEEALQASIQYLFNSHAYSYTLIFFYFPVEDHRPPNAR